MVVAAEKRAQDGSLKFSVFSFQCLDAPSSLKTEHFKRHAPYLYFPRYLSAGYFCRFFPIFSSIAAATSISNSFASAKA